MSIKYIILTTLLFTVTNIVIWFQLNSQLVWDWAKGGKGLMFTCALAIPISLALWLCTKWGYVGFGNLWSVRFMAFASSMITFPIMTYMLLGEPMTAKVIATILLAFVIMIIQVL
tara:strand:+ start:925 stop:1269 length:345 start_codon:yes stop_codon:yes gene_type:complete